ncbi:syntaxin binding protein 5 [Echinococcus multilocularis]|uniref:Syntaxin binding protein 5 n=1 Tax=Echinococcus multilocularis TaxID=6211 RepID=A0A068Y3B3_ECHMU|nr:syntaxin binding protein 5 [Echinococcus multilocularis]
MGFDPVQRILAVGTMNGCIKLFGRPGVEFHLEHPSSAAVLQLIFLVNEGGLISVCQDDIVHLWNIRQKPPDIVHSLHFKRETLTCGYLAVSSSWLSVGSEQGNVHFVNIQHFCTSGYVINWNRAINVTQSQRPGAVVQLAEHPQDSNRLLIGYSSGLLVLWDLRAKAAEVRFQYHETLYSFAWHWEGKGFVSAHSSGTIVTWALSQPKRPQSVICPHAGDDNISNSQFSFEPIRCVQWLPTKTGESIIVFSGGSRRDCLDAVIDDEGNCTTPSITIMRGRRLAVMQMDFKVVTFTTLCTSPYFNETCDPYAVAVLLQQDLVLVDLLTPGYPSFENPYPMDIAVTPVTSCFYVVDCPSDLVPAFYAVGSRGKRAIATSKSTIQEGAAEGQTLVTSNDSFSSKRWPIDGGEWGTNFCSYQELIITGHADGSVRFWDASGVNLSPLYKVRTSRYFDRSVMPHVTSLSSRGGNFNPCTTLNQSSCITPDQLYANAVVEPLAIRHIRFCVESRTLLLAGQRHLCLLSFCRSESAFEIPVLDIYLQYEEDQAVEPSVGIVDETSSLVSSSSGRRGTPQVPANSASYSTSPIQAHTEKEGKVSVIVRAGVREWNAGYQPSLICRLAAPNLFLSPSEAGASGYTSNPSPISAIALTSATNLFAFGTDGGITVVDYYQGTCLVCVAAPELEALDPLVRSRPKSSSRFANSGNGFKTTAAVSIASSGGTSNNQSSPPTLPKQKSTILPHSPPPPIGKTASSWHLFRLPWKHRVTNTSFHHPLRKIYRSTGRRFSSIMAPMDSTSPQSAQNPSLTTRRLIYFHSNRASQKQQRQMSTLPEAPILRIFDFRGTDKAKPKIVSVASPETVMASSPLLASMMFPKMEPNKGESNPLLSLPSDKYGDSASQRQSDTSEQSSIDQSVLEGIRTLTFVDMSDRKNEPSLWVGTNRGSVFGFTLDTSEDSNSLAPGYNLLGSLFKFDGEVVCIGFGNSQGELCTAPSAKWDAGSSAVPRLTLVPHLEETAESAEFKSSEGVVNASGFAASESAAFRRLGCPTPNSPMSSRRAGNKWKSNGPPGTPIPPGLTHSGNQGMGGTVNSQEEVPSSSGSNQSSLDSADRYFMVVISEKHAQVIGFPSRNCYSRVKITETSAVIRAEMSNQRMPFSTSISASQLSTATPTTVLFISCLLSNGHLIAFSLPSLRILSDVEVVGKPFHRTLFTFGNLGHAIYMSSPSELTKISMSADLSNNLSEMQGELFLPCNMPEPPKRNFFTNLFTGNGLSSADKDALFGEKQAGKSACGTAALLPSGRMDRFTGQAGGATSEIGRARNAALERGEKLSHLDTQVQEMMDQSKNLGKTAAMLAAKYEKQDKCQTYRETQFLLPSAPFTDFIVVVCCPLSYHYYDLSHM